jgi:hypothetical protein
MPEDSNERVIGPISGESGERIIGPSSGSSGSSEGYSSYGPSYNPSPGALSAMNFIRPFISAAAGGVGNTLGGALGGAVNPALAPPGAVLGGTSFYTGTDLLLKHLEGVRTNNEAMVADSIKDSLINEFVTKVPGMLFKGAKWLNKSDIPEFYSLRPTASQTLAFEGNRILATLAKFLEDYGIGAGKAKALDDSAGAGFTQALHYANEMSGNPGPGPKNVAKFMDNLRYELQNAFVKAPEHWKRIFEDVGESIPRENTFEAIDRVLTDPDKFNQTLIKAQSLGTGTNVKKDLQAYHFMQMMNKASVKGPTGEATKINMQELQELWHPSNTKEAITLDRLYDQTNRSNIDTFFQNLNRVQENPGMLENATRYLIRKGAFFSLGTDFLRHGVNLGSISNASEILLSTGVIGRLLTNKKTGPLIANMVGGKALDMPLQVVSRLVAEGLENMPVIVNTAKGKINAIIRKDGKNGGWFADPQ